jgi:hypothetical protein
MEGDRRRSRTRSFLIGGLLGASAALAAASRRRPRPQPPRQATDGLAAFEQAPCFGEIVEQERAREREAALPTASQAAPPRVAR